MEADFVEAASPVFTAGRFIGWAPPATSTEAESIAIRLFGETSFAGMCEETWSEGIGSLDAATTAGFIMVTFGGSGVVDGGHTVLAHVGGLHLTDSMSGFAIEVASHRPTVFRLRSSFLLDLGWSCLSRLSFESPL